MLAPHPSPGSPAPRARGRHRATPATLRRFGTIGSVATVTAALGGFAVTQLGQDRSDAATLTSRVAAAPAERVVPRAATRPERVSRAAGRASTRPATLHRPAARTAAGARLARIAPAVAAGSVAVPASLAPRAASSAPRWVKPVDRYVLTSRFGPRWGGFHHGLDFACPTGTPLRALGDGVVTNVRSKAPVYGQYVDVRFADGSLGRYGHMSRMDVKIGDKVTPGQVIGLSGNAGRSTGPHLHLEIHAHGDPNMKDAVDPFVELLRRGVRV